MTIWIDGSVRPNGRVWALVLWRHAYHPIPKVMQYDPTHDMWYGHEHWDTHEPEQVEWVPFPAHGRFNTKTHALAEGDCQ